MTVTVENQTAPLEAQRDADRGLCAAVQAALYRYDPIRTSDSEINAVCADGVVTLAGVVRSRVMKIMAVQVARQVPGVVDVKDKILSDTDIEAAIALAFAQDDDLRQAGGIIRVKSILGVVYLAGDVAAESLERAEVLREYAAELAAAAPGVVRVINGVAARERGQAVVAVAEQEDTGGLSAAQEAELAELRERRGIWAERAGA
jgi:osmotically-inducible protein OsmY